MINVIYMQTKGLELHQGSLLVVDSAGSRLDQYKAL